MAMEDAKTAERETWGSPLEFLLSCIAMSVGLGTKWRRVVQRSSPTDIYNLKTFDINQATSGDFLTRRTRTAAARSSSLTSSCSSSLESRCTFWKWPWVSFPATAALKSGRSSPFSKVHPFQQPPSDLNALPPCNRLDYARGREHVEIK